MKNYVIVADQDRGKSFFIKEEILKKLRHRPTYINDVNLEYSGFKNQFRGVPSKENFLKAVPIKIKPTPSAVNVVWEEATGFISRVGVIDAKMGLHIFRRYHTKNVNVFVFHGLNFINIDILPAIDFFVIFRTSDDYKQLQKKFGGHPMGERIIRAWLKVQKITEGTSFNREKKTYPDEYSRKYFHHKIIVAK